MFHHVIDGAMRRGLRRCSLKSLWQQYSFPVTTSSKDPSVLSLKVVHVWGTEQSQTCVASSLLSPVRFYTQGSRHSEDLEEMELGEFSLPTVIQADDTASPYSGRRHPFYEHLKHCGSPSEVLDLTCHYSPTEGQVSNCLTHMWSITTKMSNKQRHRELQLMFEHPAFDKLLHSAMWNVGHMSMVNIVSSLKSMVRLGVPQRSRVIQTFLRTCQEKLNDFDETDLADLACCLEQMENSPNVVALKEGMRLVVEERLLTIKNVTALQAMMCLMGKDAPLYLKRILVEKALSMADQFSLPNAYYMISTMATMDFFSKPLLDICSKKIRENLHGVPFCRLYTLLRSCRDLNYRDRDLFTDISDSASMTDTWTNKQFILLLSKFESLIFCPAALMEVFAERLMANPGSLTLKDLLCVLQVYASLNYDLQHKRQPFLDSLSQALDSYIPQMSGFQLLKTVNWFCQLGHFPPAPLERLLESSTLEQFKNIPPGFLHDCQRMFQTVNLCLRLDRPLLPRPLTVPPCVLGKPALINPSVNPWFSQSLRTVLGDQAGTMLQERIVVENSYVIDGVITKTLPNQTCEAEESHHAGEVRSPAESSQRMAVICTPYFCYGTSNPRGFLAVRIRHLRIMGYEPVLVMKQKLLCMPEEKRVAFLRKLISIRHTAR